MNTTMTTQTDVLGHLASMAAAHGDKWAAIHDAVAELMEADREYDAALDDFNNIAATPPCWPHMRARFERAKERRASALANMGPQP